MNAGEVLQRFDDVGRRFETFHLVFPSAAMMNQATYEKLKDGVREAMGKVDPPIYGLLLFMGEIVIFINDDLDDGEIVAGRRSDFMKMPMYSEKFDRLKHQLFE